MTKSAPPYPTSPPRPVMPTGIRWHTPSKTHSAKTAKTYGTTGQDKATTTRLVLPKPLGNPPSLKQAASPLPRCLSKLATTVTAPKSPTSPPTRSSAPESPENAPRKTKFGRRITMCAINPPPDWQIPFGAMPKNSPLPIWRIPICVTKTFKI